MSASAQTSTDVSFDPEVIMVNKEVGGTGNIERSIFVRNEIATPVAFRIIPGDLVNNNNDEWISSSNIELEPSYFNITAGGHQTLTLRISAPDARAGAYEGKLFLVGENSATSSIPVTFTIHEGFGIAMVLVIGGVVANLGLKLTRFRITEKQSGEDAIEAADDSEVQARDVKKNSTAEYFEGMLELNSAREYQAEGNYRESKKRAKRAEDLFKKAVSSTTPLVVEMPPPPAATNVGERLGGNIWHTISRSDYLIYFGLSITLGVSILQVWQQFFPTISAFGSSGLDYVAAFLFGYASEALLSEAFDFAKRT